MESPAAERSSFVWIGLSAAALFFLSFLLHYPFPFASRSTDLIPLWYRTQSSGHPVPYVDYAFEYPALSGGLFYLATLASTVYGFYYAITLILYAFMMVGLYAVYKVLRLSGKPINRINQFVILTPSFVLFSIYSFDWIGASLLILAVYFASTRRAFPSGLFLGLSVAARLIPIVCLPFVALEIKGAKQRVMLLGACTGAWLATNLYFMIVNFQGFLYSYVFQAQYSSEDSWLQIIYLLSPTLSKIVSALLLVSLLALILFWRNKFTLPEACMLALLAFVLVSYKFPPQYMIILIPFFALNRVRYRLSITTNTLNVLIFLLWILPTSIFGEPTQITSPVQWVAILRQLTLLPIFLGYFRSGRLESGQVLPLSQIK